MTKRQQTQKGFTLVELAIVLVIVGLLIAGILKGQELITNAQVTSTIQQLESFGGAVNTFKQNYGSYPGDMGRAQARLPDCTAANFCNNGTGDSIIGQNVGAVPVVANENVQFFTHLRKAELLSSYDGTNVVEFGAALPSASIGGGYTVGDTRTGVTGPFNATGATNEFRQGPYLVLINAPVAAAAGTGILTPLQAGRVDRTIDDGAPNSGSVVGESTAGCRVAGPPVAYNESNDGIQCLIANRLPL